MILRWCCALTAAGVLTGFAFLLVTGRYTNDGPTVAVVTPEHGLHAGDLFVLGGWAVGIVAIVLLAVLRPADDRVGAPVRR